MTKLSKEKRVQINAENFSSADEWRLYECMIEIQDSLKRRIQDCKEAKMSRKMMQHLAIVTKASNDLLVQTTTISTN